MKRVKRRDGNDDDPGKSSRREWESKDGREREPGANSSFVFLRPSFRSSVLSFSLSLAHRPRKVFSFRVSNGLPFSLSLWRITETAETKEHQRPKRTLERPEGDRVIRISYSGSGKVTRYREEGPAWPEEIEKAITVSPFTFRSVADRAEGDLALLAVKIFIPSGPIFVPSPRTNGGKQ